MTGSPDGILGEVVAFSLASEEQARKTLHGHFLIWLKLFSEMRDALFDDDPIKREAARAKFYEYIDKVLSASYRGKADWIIEHKCRRKLIICLKSAILKSFAMQGTERSKGRLWNVRTNVV